MQNKIVIFLFFILVSACSVSRFEKQNKKVNSIGNKNIEFIESQNITNESFNIKKIDIELISGDENRKFIASVKFQKPDSFLISIRSVTGLEAARIFFTRDTFMVNDRLNKILLYGSASDIKRKYGFNLNMFPLLLGDIIIDHKNELKEINCNDLIRIDSYIKGDKIEYLINCETGRANIISVMNEVETKLLHLEFIDFKKYTKKYFAKKEKIIGFGTYGSLNIEFNKIESPWSGKIEFIPGRKYELVQIK